MVAQFATAKFKEAEAPPTIVTNLRVGLLRRTCTSPSDFRRLTFFKAVTIQWTGLLDWTTGLDYWTHGNYLWRRKEQDYTEIRHRHTGKTWLFSIAPSASARFCLKLEPQS